MTARSSTNFWLEVVSLVVMIGLTATGGIIEFVLPPGTGHSHVLLGFGRHDIGRLHFYLAVTAVALLAVHVLLHWSWICCVAGKAIRHPAPSRRAQAAWGLGLLLGVALLLGGVLWSASSLVQRTAPGSHGRRGQSLGGTLPDQAPCWIGSRAAGLPRHNGKDEEVSGEPCQRRLHLRTHVVYGSGGSSWAQRWRAQEAAQPTGRHRSARAARTSEASPRFGHPRREGGRMSAAMPITPLPW